MGDAWKNSVWRKCSFFCKWVRISPNRIFFDIGRYIGSYFFVLSVLSIPFVHTKSLSWLSSVRILFAGFGYDSTDRKVLHCVYGFHFLTSLALTDWTWFWFLGFLLIPICTPSLYVHWVPFLSLGVTWGCSHISRVPALPKLLWAICIHIERKGKERKRKKKNWSSWTFFFPFAFRFWICSGLRPDAEFGNPLWGGIINNTTKPEIWLVVMDGDLDLHYVPDQDHHPFRSYQILGLVIFCSYPICGFRLRQYRPQSPALCVWVSLSD